MMPSLVLTLVIASVIGIFTFEPMFFLVTVMFGCIYYLTIGLPLLLVWYFVLSKKQKQQTFTCIELFNSGVISVMIFVFAVSIGEALINSVFSRVIYGAPISLSILPVVIVGFAVNCLYIGYKSKRLSST